MWSPLPGRMSTRWSAQVTPENAWQEYPRPQMVRKEWLNLNGLWDYAVAPKDQPEMKAMQGQILVPFPIESALSGVGRALGADERLWYTRTFQVPPAWHARRILLHFGAVDWETKVFVNGRSVGDHVGGYLPFWFDITEALVEGENELVLSVWDPTDDGWQQRGKQVRKPKTIWYTAVSGIWQTVWLEPVPDVFITGLRITPDLDAGSLHLRVGLNRKPDGVKVRILDAGRLVEQGTLEDDDQELTLPVPQAVLWSPDSPHLYDLEIEAGQDRVESYFGMRKFSQENGRLLLNNQPLFQYGPLDQGYWPDGLYTPPSEQAMRWDIELVKRLGCNMLRKHVKVEPASYYYHCDRLGLIVWQDMPSGGAAVNEMSLFFLNLFGLHPRDHNYRRAGRSQPQSRWDFSRELQEMIDHLHSFACIGMWVPFNESWGQFDARATAAWVKEMDPTRPVDHASGWFDQGAGDCKSLHIYFLRLKIKKPGKKRAVVLSEFGGYSLKFAGHLWDAGADFGYKKFSAKDALTEAYIDLLEDELVPWIRQGLSAAVYIQTTDVENEINGFVTYDREMEKMDFDQVRQAHINLIKMEERRQS